MQRIVRRIAPAYPNSRSALCPRQRILVPWMRPPIGALERVSTFEAHHAMNARRAGARATRETPAPTESSGAGRQNADGSRLELRAVVTFQRAGHGDLAPDVILQSN